MSYYLNRVYVCDVCKKEEIASSFFGIENFPNTGWGGDPSEKGASLCPDCYKAFKELRKKQHKNEI